MNQQQDLSKLSTVELKAMAFENTLQRQQLEGFYNTLLSVIAQKVKEEQSAKKSVDTSKEDKGKQG